MDGARNRESIWLAVGLACLTIAAYWGVWSNGFVNWDDQQYVYENSQVSSGLSAANIVWAWTTGACSNWHPLTWLSLMLDATLLGRGPTGFHTINLVLHVANVLLLFSVLRQFTGELRLSACVAGLFAVHPTHVESVAWISERKDVLCFFFGLLSLRAYGDFVQRQRQRADLVIAEGDVFPRGCCLKTNPKRERGRTLRRIRNLVKHPPSLTLRVSFAASPHYLFSLVAFAASLLAKPMLVTLPCLLLLLDFWPLGRLRWRDNVRPLLIEKLPYLALTILSCVITYQVQRAGGAVEVHLPLPFRGANAVSAYGHYVMSLLMPIDFSVFYPHAMTEVSWGPVVGSAVGLVLFTLLAVGLRHRAPFVAVGWLWFLGMLVPVIGIIQVGTQARADRYLYIPAIGVDLIVVWSAAALIKRSNASRIIAPIMMVIVLAVLAAMTNAQTKVWQNSVTLWSHALRVSGSSFRVRTQLAQSLQAVGERDAAQTHYLEAFKLQPDDPHLNVNYGLFLAQKDRFAESIPYFQTALKQRPRDSRTLGLLGFSLWRNGDHAEAEDVLTKAIKADPNWSRPYYWLGQLFADTNRTDKAIEQLRQAVRIEPTWKLARVQLQRLEGIEKETK